MGGREFGRGDGCRVFIPRLKDGKDRMQNGDKKRLLRRLYEECPEIEELGLFTIVIGKNRRY